VLTIIFRTIIEKLGDDRSKKVMIVGIEEAGQSLYGQLVSGKVIASGLDEELAKEATRAGMYFLSFYYVCVAHACIYFTMFFPEVLGISAILSSFC